MNGNIVLLGCFTGAEQIGGDFYLQKIANYTGQTVYGNQGLTYIGRGILSNTPLGGGWDGGTSYKDLAEQNAGAWRIAKFNQATTISIQNIRINYRGEISQTSKLYGSPSSSTSKK